MEDLPNILIRKTAFSLPFTEITRLCRTSKQFNQAICHFQQFWYDKLVLDYGITEKFSERLNWRKIYIHYLYRLIGLGSNRLGQLGLGQIAEADELTEIPTVVVKDIACGFNHTIVIDAGGNLWGAGGNVNGQLGSNTEEREVINFVKLTYNSKFIQVACGYPHTLALSEDNRIWVIGSNMLGEIGLGRIRDAHKFTELKGYRAKQISCGERHSAFIDLNGNLYTFGDNHDGQLGRDGDNAIPNKVLIPGNVPVIQVSCGVAHTACIDANNDIWVFGSSSYGKLGLGMRKYWAKRPINISNHKAKFVSCGNFHTGFIDLEDHVWTFGDNGTNQLGLQGIKSSFDPTKITQVYDGGQIMNRDFRVKQVYCSRDITSFIDLENNLWVAGNDERLNINSEVPAMIPRIKANKVATGDDYMVVIGYFN